VVGIAAERGDPQRTVRRIGARLATAAELRKVNVCDADLAKRCFEGLRAEVRVPTRSGEEPYVRESSDLGVTKHRDELLERPRAVSDRPDVHVDQCGRLGR